MPTEKRVVRTIRFEDKSFEDDTDDGSSVNHLIHTETPSSDSHAEPLSQLQMVGRSLGYYASQRQ